MKVQAKITYEEAYIPPRCRKVRYKECDDVFNTSIKEANLSEASLAFEDNSFQGKGKIYEHKGKLYAKVDDSYFLSDMKERGMTEIDTPLKALKYRLEENGARLTSYDRKYEGKNTSKEAVKRQVRKSLERYLIIDGELYEKVNEPRYCVVTFGLGHNHGGTGLFCEYHYNPNIPKQNYFPANKGKEALEYFKSVALGRGDTESVGAYDDFIVCHRPDLVKLNPQKQHNSGNKVLNEMEDIIKHSENTMEAGLLLCSLCSLNL